MKYVLHTDKPLAYDSPDHIYPFGTANDNHVNATFNKKLYALFGGRTISVLDLGCSGGGFVRNCIADGHIAVGLEGSDYSLKHRRAEWATIPEHLFTCDITAPFGLFAEVNGDSVRMAFDAVTAWEVIEHIKTDDLALVTANVLAHLKPGGLWIMSVSPNEEVRGGLRLHQTVQEEPWWLEHFKGLGMKHHPDLVTYFTPDWVRGPHNAHRSFHLILTRWDEEPAIDRMLVGRA